MDRYVADIVARGELYLEIERMRQLLIRLNKTPKESRHDIQHAERMFKALLRVKEARSHPNTSANNQ